MASKKYKFGAPARPAVKQKTVGSLVQHLQEASATITVVPGSGVVSQSVVSAVLKGGGLQLSWHDVALRINERNILDRVSGLVRPGQMLAVMGPSGSGKTTLLNILSGRKTADSGLVLLEGQPVNKALRRQICYVLQQDIFFPTLTLKDTLWYTALLRLPDDMPRLEKQLRIEDIVKSLDINKCMDTIIGDAMNRGLSGGEKKRANIAAELLTNPKVMLLDEPTSGLDSSTALDLINTLKDFSQTHNKTVVTTIHQPSSQMFHMFDNILLLSDGQIAYYGTAHEVLDFFAGVGLVCESHYNPADFILEQVRSGEEAHKRLVAAANKLREGPDWPEELKQDTTALAKLRKMNSKGQLLALEKGSGDHAASNGTNGVSTGAVTINMEPHPNELAKIAAEASEQPPRWPTSWWTQFSVLTRRNFRHSRQRILSKLMLIQNATILIVVGIIWFRIALAEETIIDRTGLLFFIVVYWSFNPMFDCLTSFPEERTVINKERSSGAYRLSAYYCAKMASELPLVLLQPFVFFCVVYWMTNIGGGLAFVPMLLLLLFNAVTAQSIGLFISASVLNLKTAITVCAVFMLTSMLLGGFYTRTIPWWLTWSRWISFVTHSYSIFLIFGFQLDNDGRVPCHAESVNQTAYSVCQEPNATYIPAHYILNELHVQLPFYYHWIILSLFLIVFRTLGYIMLRFTNKPHTA